MTSEQKKIRDLEDRVAELEEAAGIGKPIVKEAKFCLTEITSRTDTYGRSGTVVKLRTCWGDLSMPASDAEVRAWRRHADGTGTIRLEMK